MGLASAGSVMVALDATVVTTALSRIRVDLGTSMEQLEWTVNAYSLSFAVLLMTGAVLGDRFGSACAPALSTLAEQAFEAMGYRCARNAPYAGGYTTEHYGRPARRTHALQIEINRALYLDETSRLSTAGFAQLSRDIAAFAARLAAFDWSSLR